MGNFLWRCLGGGDNSKSETPVEQHYTGHYSRNGYGAYSPPRPGPDTVPVFGFRAFYRDLKEFQTTLEVPEGLSNYVSASRTSQRLWFFRLLAAWKQENPAPASTKDVAQLIFQTIQGDSNIQGFLKFYHLPWPIVSYTQPLHVPTTQQLLAPTTQPLLVPVSKPYWEKFKASGTRPVTPVFSILQLSRPIWPITPQAIEGVQYKICTLPVTWNKDFGDGDGITVFVNVLGNARETQLLPKEIHDAALLRHKARARKNYKMADALQKKIEDAEYKVFDGKNGEARCLAHKYRIRLRGVDAPETEQPYGKEARDKLRSLVKDQQLLICVYDIDPYGRTVGDIYCNGMFIQEELLKKGSVWHYKHYDKRENFAKWQRAARVACVGLWANPNPEPPWDYKKRVRNENPFRIRGA